MLLGLYRLLTQIFAFLIRRYLKSRVKNGKEDINHLRERYGQASYPRPQGFLIWIHAVSVGESMSTLALIEKLLQTRNDLHILLTTGTITAAQIMKKILPKRAIHQYSPVDVPSWVQSFLDHWQPQLVLCLESEIWPNMIQAIQTRQIPLFLLNGRVSDQTYRRWMLIKNTIATLLKAFHLCFAQSKLDQERLLELGAHRVIKVGNLKFSARPLSVDEGELLHLKTMTKDRPVWLAASTHEGEETIVAHAHHLICKTYPDALCIIIPRHPQRASKIVEHLNNQKLARRSLGETIRTQTQIYLADTLNELGLFYRFVPIAFVGGSLVPIGGHNIIEPIQLGCIPIHGPFMDKTREIAAIFHENAASFIIHDAPSLAQTVQSLLASAQLYKTMVHAGRQVLTSQAQVLEHILKELSPWLKHAQD
jgi:3-deoxy-D-manno-octulosonic-acid transferase